MGDVRDISERRRIAFEAVQRIFGGGNVFWYDDASARVELGRVDFVVSYKELRELADAFGTEDIQLHHEVGFGSSDVTPADPDELILIVRHIPS